MARHVTCACQALSHSGQKTLSQNPAPVKLVEQRPFQLQNESNSQGPQVGNTDIENKCMLHDSMTYCIRTKDTLLLERISWEMLTMRITSFSCANFVEVFSNSEKASVNRWKIFAKALCSFGAVASKTSWQNSKMSLRQGSVYSTRRRIVGQAGPAP